MAELVDALDSKSGYRKVVQVRFLFWAQKPRVILGAFLFSRPSRIYSRKVEEIRKQRRLRRREAFGYAPLLEVGATKCSRQSCSGHKKPPTMLGVFYFHFLIDRISTSMIKALLGGIRGGLPFSPNANFEGIKTCHLEPSGIIIKASFKPGKKL